MTLGEHRVFGHISACQTSTRAVEKQNQSCQKKQFDNFVDPHWISQLSLTSVWASILQKMTLSCSVRPKPKFWPNLSVKLAEIVRPNLSVNPPKLPKLPKWPIFREIGSFSRFYSTLYQIDFTKKKSFFYQTIF